MSKLNEFLYKETVEQRKEWIDNPKDYGMKDIDDPAFSDAAAFEAVVDWVIEDLKNMHWSDVVKGIELLTSKERR